MELKNINVGFALTGSFCTFKKVIPKIKELKDLGANILPIMSYNSYNFNTKFGKAKDFIEEIQGAEPIGPKSLTDIMVVAPCSGNTLAKLANSIIDTPSTMAIKSHLRNQRPLVVGISTNDGLSGSAENIGKLLNRKNYYFVPFTQDNPITKPTSLVFKFDYLIPTIKEALNNKQLQPIIG